MSPRGNFQFGFVKRGEVSTPVAGCLMETRLSPGEGTATAPLPRIPGWLYKGSGLYVLNIALAYFVVNYSDVNCIVNKAATFFSFPIIVIKCAGAGSGEPKQQAGLRLPRLALE